MYVSFIIQCIYYIYTYIIYTIIWHICLSVLFTPRWWKVKENGLKQMKIGSLSLGSEAQFSRAEIQFLEEVHELKIPMGFFNLYCWYDSFLLKFLLEKSNVTTLKNHTFENVNSNLSTFIYMDCRIDLETHHEFTCFGSRKSISWCVKSFWKLIFVSIFEHMSTWQILSPIFYAKKSIPGPQ